MTNEKALSTVRELNEIAKAVCLLRDDIVWLANHPDDNHDLIERVEQARNAADQLTSLIDNGEIADTIEAVTDRNFWCQWIEYAVQSGQFGVNELAAEIAILKERHPEETARLDAIGMTNND